MGCFQTIWRVSVSSCKTVINPNGECRSVQFEQEIVGHLTDTDGEKVEFGVRRHKRIYPADEFLIKQGSSPGEEDIEDAAAVPHHKVIVVKGRNLDAVREAGTEF